MLDPMQILTSRPDIFLRQLTPEDAEPLFALIDRNRGHLSQWGEPTSINYPELESVFRSITHSSNPLRLRFGVWRATELVGSINLTYLKYRSVIGEIGYWIGSEYTRQGIATTAVVALTQYASSTLGMDLLFGTVHEDNHASQQVLKRAGYRPMQLRCDHKLTLMHRPETAAP